MINKKKIKKILITRTDRIGDVVLSTPVFEALKTKFPDAELYVLVQPYVKEVVKDNKFVSHVISYDKRGKHKSFISTIKFAWHLKQEKIDLAIHLHPTNRVHFISFFAGIKYRLGYKKKLGFLLTHAIKDEKAEGVLHEAEYNFKILDKLNISLPEKIKPLFNVSEVDSLNLKKLLTELKLTLQNPYLIFPFASCPSKCWPLEKYINLIHKIRNNDKADIIIVGGIDDIETGKYIEKSINFPIINLVGKLSLKELGALFLLSKLLITNDSGPAHIAASLDLPVISIFGRSDKGLSPKRWRPLGENSFFIHKNPGCIKCEAHNCSKEFECLQNITSDEIMELIKKINDSRKD